MSGRDLIVIPQKVQWPQRSRVLALALVVLVTTAVLWTGARTRQYVLASARHPPWIYGRPDARFTVVEFADLECAYCRMYFPTLRAWVDAHPDVNWEWRHLPLALHEPAATQAARLVECAGEIGGPPLFWSTVEWLYDHADRPLPLLTEIFGAPQLEAIRICLQSDRPDAIVRRQVAEAAREEITATPTLRLIDRRLGGSLTLTGVVPPDALSSAIDELAAPTVNVSASGVP